MCGRINIIDDPALSLLLQSLGAPQMAAESMINVAPTERIPVVTGPAGVRELRPRPPRH